MKLSEFQPAAWHCHGLYAAKPGTSGVPDLERPLGRVEKWAYALRRFGADMYGDWNIRDTEKGAACDGTVVATLRGSRGTVEAWNGCDVVFVPKGVRKSRHMDWDVAEAEDAANGISWRFGSHDMPRDIAWACALAGIDAQGRLAI